VRLRNHFYYEDKNVNVQREQVRQNKKLKQAETRTSQVCIFVKKTVLLHALHVRFQFLYILQAFPSFLRGEMTSFVVV